MNRLRRTAIRLLAVWGIWGAGGPAVSADPPPPQSGGPRTEKLLLSFEKESESSLITANGTKSIVARHASEGSRALELTFDQVRPEFTITFSGPTNFSEYERIKFDTFLVGTPMTFDLKVRDAGGKDYTSWYYLVNEGRQTVEYSIPGMASAVDVTRIASLQFWMEGSLPAAAYMVDASSKGEKIELGRHSSVLYLDNVRLHRGISDDSWLMPAGGAPKLENKVNLIPNGDFELGLQRWGSWGTWDGGAYFFGSGRGENAHSGAASASIVCQKVGRGGIMTDPPFVLKKGSYRLSFWVKGTSPRTKTYYDFEGPGLADLAEGASCDRFDVPPGWTEKSVRMTAAADTRPLTFYIYHVGEGTLYIDDVTLVPEGGAPAPLAREESFQGTPSLVTLKGRATYVNGKPFFPLGFYGKHPEAYSGTPFNYITFHEINEEADAKRLFDECQKLGVMTQVPLSGLMRAHLPATAPAVARRYKRHPALFAWYLCDEPDHGRWNVPPPELRLARKLLQAEDPNHPTWTTVMPWAPSNLYQYADATDILASDVYPDLDKKPVDVLSIAQATETMRKAHGGPVWMVPLSHPKATPAEEVAMTYLALAHGATGLVYWTLEDARSNPDFWKVMCAIGSEVRALAPALLAESAPEPAKASDPRIHLLLKEGPEGSVLVAVNASPQAAAGVSMRVPGAEAGEAEVLFEGRRFRVSDGRVTDNFAGYERHVYRFKR